MHRDVRHFRQEIAITYQLNEGVFEKRRFASAVAAAGLAVAEALASITMTAAPADALRRR
ncbi:hypothetical protein [Streptomyces sp. NBC_00623]|uniref:hypothetical protein n=1 Tax=Streptomyces sp. NBC_00623 TaxID=2975790 RepID=UPI0030E37C0C